MALDLLLSFYILQILSKYMNRKFRFRRKGMNNSVKKIDVDSRGTGELTLTDTNRNKSQTPIDTRELDTIAKNVNEEKETLEKTTEDKSLAFTTSVSNIQFPFTFTLSGEIKIDSAMRKPNENPAQANINVNTKLQKLDLSWGNDKSHSVKTNADLESAIQNDKIHITKNETNPIINGTQTQAFASAVQNFVQNLVTAVNLMPAASSIAPSGSEESVNAKADELPLPYIDGGDKEASSCKNPISVPVGTDQKKSSPKFDAAKSSASVSEVERINNISGFVQDPVEKPVAIGSFAIPAPFCSGEKKSEPVFSFGPPVIPSTEKNNNSCLVFGSTDPVPPFPTLGEKKSSSVFASALPAASSGQEQKTIPAINLDTNDLDRLKYWTKSQGYSFAAPVFDLEKDENKSTLTFDFGKPVSSLGEKKSTPVGSLQALAPSQGQNKATSVFNSVARRTLATNSNARNQIARAVRRIHTQRTGKNK